MRAHNALWMTMLVACSAEPTTPDPTRPPVQLPPNHGLRDVSSVPGGTSPFGTSSFVFSGPTAPGDASFVNAPVADAEALEPPAIFGGGTINVTVSGQVYTAAATESLAFTVTDPDGEYLALESFTTYPGPGGVEYANQAVVIVLRSDFAVGATVALDGQDRIVLFANGPAEAEEPTVFAAAITGSVTFTAGATTLGSTISATVTGDFGAVDYLSEPPPGGGSITAGGYGLAVVGPAEVYCDGTLAGQEASFAGVTQADLGFVDGAVTVTSPAVAVAGAPITSAFGASSLALDDMEGVFAAFTDLDEPGPAGTTLVGKYLVLDGATATATFINGGMGAGYLNAAGDGSCTVAFGATLIP